MAKTKTKKKISLEGWRKRRRGRESLSSDLERITRHVTDIGGSDGIGEMGIRPPSSGVSIRESLAKFRSFPAECRGRGWWKVVEETGGETGRKAGEREGRYCSSKQFKL